MAEISAALNKAQWVALMCVLQDDRIRYKIITQERNQGRNYFVLPSNMECALAYLPSQCST